MTWLYPAEIVPLRIRAPANALSTSANWVYTPKLSVPIPSCIEAKKMQAFNFMVVMITPVAFASVKYKTYVIFAVM